MTLTTSKKAEPSSTEVGFSDDHELDFVALTNRRKYTTMRITLRN